MKTFQIKQHSKMALPIGIAYLVTIFLVCYFLFGGIDGMADRVNSMGSPRGAGFIVSIVVLVPLFILLRFIHPLVTITIDTGKMMIRQKRRKEVVILLQAIDRMEWNISGINRADLYDRQNRLMASFRDTKDADAVKQVIEEIAGHAAFERTVASRRLLSATIETELFKRK